MPKQQTPLRYVAKIQSSRFAKAKFDLKVSFDDMRRSGEIVALGDSQMFDFIDELRGVTDDELLRLPMPTAMMKLRPLLDGVVLDSGAV